VDNRPKFGLTTNSAMDKIHFKIEKSESGDSVRIFINNKDLISILKEFETTFIKSEGSENIAGAYAGLPSEELLEKLTAPPADNKVTILGCECGSEGCWPFMTRIMESEDKIIWTDFEQPHRGPESYTFWDYTPFGRFTFEKNDYILQVEKLKSK